MSKQEKKSILTKGTVLSIVLHLLVIGFIVFWGVGKHKEQSDGAIEVSLSTGDFGEGGSGNFKDKQQIAKQNKKEQPVKKQEEKEVLKSKEPEKKVEPEKEVVKKEEPEEKIVEKKEEKIPEKIVKQKEEPEKKEIKEIPLPEKKIEPEKEVAKKEEKIEESKPENKVEEKTAEKVEVDKEVIQAEEKADEKAAETAETKNSGSSKEDILKEIKRNAVLKDLKKDSGGGNTKEVAANSSQGFGSGEENSQGNGGGSSSRIGSAINPIVLSTYYEVLSKRVERVLAFPPSVELDGSYTTLVRFWMNDNGRVYNVAVDKTSGSNVIDSYCVKAVNSAAPFPSPPAELQSRIKVEPFVIPCKNEG
ncbi:MAG: cell envelope integrity protein TolA [Thermodesulfobacteriota bacterium]